MLHRRDIGGIPSGMAVDDEGTRDEMTETTEPTIIDEALAVIDKGLTDILNRELVSSNEVADLLLDVRGLLATTSSAN
jgi:hypothetical protein